MQRCILVGLVALLFCFSPAPVFEPVPAHADPYVLNGQDGAVTGSDPHARTVALDRMQQAGVTSVRILVLYRQKRLRSWKRYDEGVDAVRARGMVPQIVITGSGENLGVRRWKRFVRQNVRHFGRRVWRYAVYNEPNYPGWLKPLPGLSPAETYCRYYRAAYTVINRTGPNKGLNQVFFGELAAGQRPLRFMGEVLEHCGRVTTDGVAIHPYQYETPPDEEPHNAPRWLGIGALDYLNVAIDQAFAARRLVTPRGERPPVLITEFAYMSRARGHLRDRNLPPPEVAEYLPDAHQVACETPTVKMMSQYQWLPSAPVEVWPGNWDSSILSRTGHPGQGLDALMEWQQDNPHCVVPATSTPTQPPL